MCDPSFGNFAKVRPLVQSANTTTEYGKHRKCNTDHNLVHYNATPRKWYADDLSAKVKNTRCNRTKSARLKKLKISDFSELEFDNPRMQTMDRRVSSSSDQIHTLKKQKLGARPLRTHSSSRLPCEQNTMDYDHDQCDEAAFVTAKVHRKRDLLSQSFHRNIEKKGDQLAKTPYALFLEDDGPYSRKLFGPFDQREGERGRKEIKMKEIVYPGQDKKVNNKRTNNSLCFWFDNYAIFAIGLTNTHT